MKNIKLPNRYKNDVRLIFEYKEDDFYVFSNDDSFVWTYCQIMLDKENKPIGIDPEGGPYMMCNEYKIKGLVLDHLEHNDNKWLFYMKKKTSYKIGAMSDLHGYLPENVEKCDIICISGDILPLEVQRMYSDSLVWLKQNFLPWIEKLDCEKVFVIGGNHDFVVEQMSTKMINRLIRENFLEHKLVYLNNTSFGYDNIKIYGCPQVENLEGWAFYSEDCHEYTNIPQCDILLTHMPPKIGNLGYIPKYGDLGSEKLKEVLDTHKIKYWFCGHMHDGNHEWVEYNGCKLKNVSIKDDSYMPVNPVTYCIYDLEG